MTEYKIQDNMICRIKMHNAHNMEQGIVNTVDQMRKGKHPLLLQDLISVLQQTINFNLGDKNVLYVVF